VLFSSSSSFNIGKEENCGFDIFCGIIFWKEESK
jgi:hypothetical protein